MQTKVKSPLINKEIFVKAIKREGSWLQEIHEKHDGSFLWSGAKITLRGLPYDTKKRRYVDPLTYEERMWFESEESGFGVKKNDLSALKKPCYWDKFQIIIDRNGLPLSLADPMDYLRYKFLLVQPQIAPSWEERFEDAAYKFAIVDKDIEIATRVTLRNKKSSAERAFGRMENSLTKMSNFLKLYYLGKSYKVPEGVTLDFLVSEIEKILEDNIDKFLNIVEDTNFEMRIFIIEALSKSVVIMISKGVYKIQGEEETYTMNELITFLKGVENQKIYGKLRALVEAN